MSDKYKFISVSIKKKSYKNLSKLAKKERHTLSDELDIIIEFYEKTKEVLN